MNRGEINAVIEAGSSGLADKQRQDSKRRPEPAEHLLGGGSGRVSYCGTEVVVNV